MRLACEAVLYDCPLRLSCEAGWPARLAAPFLAFYCPRAAQPRKTKCSVLFLRIVKRGPQCKVALSPMKATCVVFFMFLRGKVAAGCRPARCAASCTSWRLPRPCRLSTPSMLSASVLVVLLRSGLPSLFLVSILRIVHRGLPPFLNNEEKCPLT